MSGFQCVMLGAWIKYQDILPVTSEAVPYFLWLIFVNLNYNPFIS